MRIVKRYICSLAAAVAAALALGQGSAAGYGQGSAKSYGQVRDQNFAGGGGFGGGQGGRFAGNAPMSEAERAQQAAKPDYDQTPDLWTTRHAVLTPGDRVEYKFKMTAGQTIFAGASSDSFDPALEFDDAKGNKLATNDDRAEGDQEPFLIYRTAADGDYVLKVLSYRSVSGGSFDVRFRTFKATDGGFGQNSHSDLFPVHAQYNNDHYLFRITGQKGKFYDLNYLGTRVAPYNALSSQLYRLVGPTGVEASDFKMIATPDGSSVFQAQKDGDYYMEYTVYQQAPKAIVTNFREMTPSMIAQAANESIDLQPSQMQIVEFTVKPNDLVRTTLTGGAFIYALSAPDAENPPQNLSNQPGFGTDASKSWFNLNVDSDRDVVRVFHGKGTAILAIRSNTNNPIKVGVQNTDQLPEWKDGAATSGSLKIGDAQIYLLHSARSEIMEVGAQADHFQSKMEIFRLSGELANSLTSPRSTKTGDNLYFPDPDFFLIRVSCEGNGGSGDYSITRNTYTPTPYSLGQTKDLTLHGDDFGLYSMDLEKGKRYELITSGYIQTDVLDDDGDFLTTQPVNLDSVVVQYFVPTKSGRHRLWLRGGGGSIKFRLEATVPPSLGS